MTNKEKVIAAFLVSMGLFSTVQANQYVGTLSAQDKASLIEVQGLAAGMNTATPSACSIDGGPCQ